MTPEEHIAAALAGLGFPPDPEMQRTPQLLSAFLQEFLPQPLPTTTPLPTRSTDLVLIKDLPYHSLCAHHLLPFFGHCTIVYRPAGQIVGLGWFPRLLHSLARQPQLQERLCATLAETAMSSLSASAVGVKLTARQMCVEMRGAASPGLFEVRSWRGDPDPTLERLLG